MLHPKSPNPQNTNKEEKMISLLANAGCTLLNPIGPPSLPPDHYKFRHALDLRFSSNPSLLFTFLTGLDSYISTSHNLQRLLLLSPAPPRQSLIRLLLLVPSLQLQLQCLLLEKLPEYFNNNDRQGVDGGLDDDVARLIVNHFRYLDFLVDAKGFTEKLLQVLSICPVYLKKEIIGSFPEMIGDQDSTTVIAYLQELLQEDSELIVVVLDSFSNLNLDDEMQEKVVTIALSCIRTVDVRHMPYLIRFLLLGVTTGNARQIISQIRHQLKFVGSPDAHSKKLKGKSIVDNFEALVLDALRSGLRFNNVLCLEILKELKAVDKAKDHKVVDAWLLMLIYANGGLLQKCVEKVLKKKIINGCFREVLFDQCIHGQRELVKEYFPSFISVCEYLLACKEQEPREFGMHLYSSLFNEFSDTYSRQEILGALVTHVGSGVSYEVSSALETMILLATKYSQEMICLFTYINGILDYLEGFNDQNLHKVYEVFSLLALSARCNADSAGSSIANELLMIIRKQVSNPDLKYKKMGLIGTLKIVSCLGEINNSTCLSSSQKTNCEESLELLKTCSDSCKWSSLPLIMFHDELIALLERKSLQPAIMDWISKHTTDFESMFLSDLEHGKLLSAESYCGLEGELWMNLDGGLSPICLSILPLVSSSLQLSSSLPVLPAHFLLLSVVERLTNRGSLGGIDALLGCPLHLPSSKYFVGAAWLSMTGKQKSSMCLSLYYATNWIRELLNAFSSQVTGRVDCMSQATREEINAKLLKRLRNLVFLESLLNTFLKSYPLALPELQISTECSGSSSLGKPNSLHQVEKKNEKKANSESNSSDNKRKRKSSKELEISDKEKLKQPTILDMLRKSGAISQEELTERLTGLSNKERIVEQPECHTHASGSGLVEISAFATVLDAQRYKCRPLSVECLYILSFSKIQNSCCSDSAAELPLHLYLLRDLHQKLGYLSLQRKQFPSGYTTRVSSGLSRLTPSEFLNNIKRLFPSLKKHLDTAVCILKEDDDATYEDHWSSLSTSAGNPDIPNLVVSKFSAAGSVFKEVFFCFRKMFILPDIQTVLSDLLEAFQPMRIPDNLFSGIELPIPLPGNIDYLYCGAFSFLASVFDIACSISVVLASEVLATLESLVHSAGTIRPESNGKSIINVQRVLPSLRNQLGTSAHKLLMHNWDNENVENGLKNKGDMIQKILRIYLKNCESTEHQLEEFSCSILPQVPPCKTASTEEAAHGFPTLNPATFIVWYRVLYEEDLEILNKLVKEAALLQKSKAHAPVESVKTLLLKLNQSVNVVVSLVNMCKTREKVTVHAMAIKFGGKFVESFLKVFDFLQEQFQVHTDIIIQLVKELQKATRIIQTLCSEAKGSKRTMITTKIPAAKRSMERFLFRVKALLHNTSNGCTFWMGNLKHKDLMGQVVSSQVYTDGNDDDAKEGNADMDEDVEEQPININSEGDRETET